MKRRVTTLVIAVFAILFAVEIWMPGDAHAFLLRLAANFRDFGVTETSTTAGAAPGGAGGQIIYSTTVFAPFSGVLYVTMSLGADEHAGRAHLFTCLVDGVPCNPGTGGAGGAPAAWINLQRIPTGSGATGNCNNGGGGSGDCHDNGVYYTWCTRVRPGTHSVAVKQAAFPAGAFVFVEAEHYYVDFSSATFGSPATCSRGLPAGNALSAEEESNRN